MELERILKDKEGCPLNSIFCDKIAKALTLDCNIRAHVIEKLLEVCIQDPRDDIKYTTEALNIVSLVLRKVMSGAITSKPDLLPSMLKIFHLIKTIVYSYTSDDIKVLYFKVLFSYPNEVYVMLEEDHYHEVLELFNLFTHQRIPIEIRVQPINILQKYLKVLPPDKRLKFVKEGINIWFHKLVPCVMVFSTTPNFEIETSLDALEMITNELLHIDYIDNTNWQSVLQCIYTPQKYPAIMKSLLEKGSDIWHRLWITFIKMLKTQITKNSNSTGSPINSMLPVVELAFKMDVRNRCRAFLCWNVLIDNFATETNDVFITKRMKLLLIPLSSNNAKVEETVVAKLNTWWHLICRFYSKLNKFTEVILIPFLQFCFGKSNVCNTNKPLFVPGLLTNKTKENCVEAFVNILGHYNCDGCVPFPKLKEKVLNVKCLTENWKDLKYNLNVSIKIVATCPTKLRQPYKCGWISFMKTLCEVPENIRKNLFNDLLEMLENLIQDCDGEILPDIVLNDFILPLFDDIEQNIQLLKPKEQTGLMQKVVLLMLNPSFDNVYERYNMNEAVKKFQPFANFITNYCFHINTIDTLLKQFPEKYNSLVLWTAVISNIFENNSAISSVPVQVLCKMLLWPLQHLDLFTNEVISTSLWHVMFDFVYTKNSTISINDEIFKLFKDLKNVNSKNASFLLKASVMLLKTKVTTDGVDYENEVDLVHHFTSRILSLNHSHQTFSTLLEVLPEIFKRLSHDINLNISRKVLSIIKIVFSLILPEFKKTAQVDQELLLKLECLLKSMEDLLKLEAYTTLKQIVLSDLIDCAPYFGQQQALKVTIVATLHIILAGMDNNNPSVNIIKNAIHTLKQDSHTVNQEQFTTPKLGLKKGKKKEANIVNTVVENGEEFVVVKSNWKFNPKKLTDNQKEKLTRKREDIPALYQDLSQSQDDFRLSTWKTDSQDTTTTTTSTKSNGFTYEQASTVLKSMPNTDVVPKIMKNILCENNEKDNSSPVTKNDNLDRTQTPSNKRVKTPRLALKDRVFRNVRNLLEKSNVQIAEKDTHPSATSTTTTPTGMRIKTTDIILNSAPSESNPERPSRLKRAPKKFEEMQVFALKKSRYTNGIRESENSEWKGDLNESQEVMESYDDHFKMVSSSNLLENQENRINLTQNMVEIQAKDEVVKEAHIENILNVDKTLHPQENKVDRNITSVVDGEKDKTPQEVDTTNENRSTDELEVINVDASKEKDQDDKKQESSVSLKKKTGRRKSRIENELAIDMVEGHPFLKAQSEKRLTRKKASESPVTSKRKSLLENLNKSKIDKKNKPRVDKKLKKTGEVVVETQGMDTFPKPQEAVSQDLSGSQDIIESSQDSTISIMSSKSTKNLKRIPIVALENIEHSTLLDKTNQEKIIQKKESYIDIDSKVVNGSEISNCENKDDTVFPNNRTAAEQVQIDLTENMDTEPMGSITAEEVIVINDEEEQTIIINTDDTFVDMDTQDIADADTESFDPKNITSAEVSNTPTEETQSLDSEKIMEHVNKTSIDDSAIQTQDESTKSVAESLLCATEKQDESSSKPFIDEEARKLDFLNNTFEISPIKTLSPVRQNKSPSPDTSSDYVVIKLSSPVNSNGEPYEKCDSPEIFTEDKMSPDKRDQSPPREVHASPRSLSLKKNKPQVRTGGRAAQMLGLCVPQPDRLQTIMNSDKSAELDEPKKCSQLNTSARRNLRILYNSTIENSGSPEENEKSEDFLKLQRNLPSADSSPAVPILKRKHADITDDTTVSPANKRKRVSFHDPPVSTTICVKKYIEPSGVRSPQNSVTKRQERQLRSQVCVNFKSPKRLDTVFKLDTALIKAVESFSEGDVTPNTNEDTEISSLEPTPLVEIVKNSELNDVDPICIDLVNCKDPIDNIAVDLSSSAMKPLLVKEFAGKIETVGDLAKLTELEVNRLCIKAPKVQVTRKVLMEYAKKINIVANEITPTMEVALNESTVRESTVVDVKMQTDCVATRDFDVQTDTLETCFMSTQTETSAQCFMSTQTEALATSIMSTQTEIVSTSDCMVQTDESGSKSTADIVTSLLQKPDFCERLNEQLELPSKQCIASSLSPSALIDNLVQKVGPSDLDDFIDRLLETPLPHSTNGRNSNLRISLYTDYLSERFSSKDLMLLCIELMKKVHGKTT